MESKPLRTFPIHEHLRPKLCDLYEKDCIFDKFEACFNHDGKYVLSGSYQNCFHLLSTDGTQPEMVLEASQAPHRRRQQQAARGGRAGGGTPGGLGHDPIDFTRRILHTAFHPSQNLVAVGATSTLYIFRA